MNLFLEILESTERLTKSILNCGYDWSSDTTYLWYLEELSKTSEVTISPETLAFTVAVRFAFLLEFIKQNPQQYFELLPYLSDPEFFREMLVYVIGPLNQESLGVAKSYNDADGRTHIVLSCLAQYEIIIRICEFIKLKTGVEVDISYESIFRHLWRKHVSIDFDPWTFYFNSDFFSETRHLATLEGVPIYWYYVNLWHSPIFQYFVVGCFIGCTISGYYILEAFFS